MNTEKAIIDHVRNLEKVKSESTVITAIGVTTPITASAGVFANTAEPTGTEVDTAITAATTKVETRLDAIEAKFDALLAAVKASGTIKS